MDAREVLKLCWLAADNDMTIEETKRWMANFALSDEHEASATAGANQILSALDAAGIVLVPKMPTEAMRIAALNTHLPGPGDPPLYELAWRAMLAAACQEPR